MVYSVSIVYYGSHRWYVCNKNNKGVNNSKCVK